MAAPSIAQAPCEASERCGTETHGDASPLASVADGLGLSAASIAPAEQGACAMAALADRLLINHRKLFYVIETLQLFHICLYFVY